MALYKPSKKTPAEEEAEEKHAPQAAGQVPRRVPQRGTWEPEEATVTLLSQRPEGSHAAGDDLLILTNSFVKASSSGAASSAGAIQELCLALRHGGHDAAEVACSAGAVEASVSLLKSSSSSSSALLPETMEVLWLLIDDYDSCQRLIRSGGHNSLLRLVREHGPKDALVSTAAFRLMAETLYSEANGSELWMESFDPQLLIEALEWAVNYEPPP
ncbi:unnamed protein product, partial [Polarella glacialis]